MPHYWAQQLLCDGTQRAHLVGIEPLQGVGASALAVKIFTIFEGTSEIQRMIIGRTLMGLDVR